MELESVLLLTSMFDEVERARGAKPANAEEEAPANPANPADPAAPEDGAGPEGGSSQPRPGARGEAGTSGGPELTMSTPSSVVARLRSFSPAVGDRGARTGEEPEGRGRRRLQWVSPVRW